MNQKYRFENLIKLPEKEEYLAIKQREQEEELTDRELWVLQNFSESDFK